MNLKQWSENLNNYLSDKQEHFTLVIQDEDEVTYGLEEECNINYCLEHGISCLNRYDNGGTIVHAKGSIGFNYIYSHDKYGGFLSTDFISQLAEYLKSKGIENVTVEKNDILIDDYKVASSAEINLAPDYRWTSTSVLISMTQNLELISHVCLKPMVKIPRALSNYGISLKEMLEFIEDWKKENIYE